MRNFDELKRRGYVYQSNNIEKLEELINNSSITFYLGVDPTADSIHIGHLFPITLARRLQKMGHKPIIVIGGATGIVGDPTGRKVERVALTFEQVNKNKENLKKTLMPFLSFEGENKCQILDNSAWLLNLKFMEFMRDVGSKFNVNQMLSSDSNKTRLEAGGLTFLEMGYSLLQAYDFYHLYKNFDCKVQIGGSDQWSNILAGTELIKKFDLGEAYSFTSPLLVDSQGKKMGKSAGNALWVDKNKISAYDFYQQLINMDDKDVKKLFYFFTDLECDYIDEICEKDIVKAKKEMAYEVTKFIRGEEDAKEAEKISEEVFSKGDSSNMPSINLNKGRYNILDLLVETKLLPSKAEARRNVVQGGIMINDEKILDPNYEINLEDEIIIKKGKKTFLKVVAE